MRPNIEQILKSTNAWRLAQVDDNNPAKPSKPAKTPAGDATAPTLTKRQQAPSQPTPVVETTAPQVETAPSPNPGAAKVTKKQKQPAAPATVNQPAAPAAQPESQQASTGVSSSPVRMTVKERNGKNIFIFEGLNQKTATSYKLEWLTEHNVAYTMDAAIAQRVEHDFIKSEVNKPQADANKKRYSIKKKIITKSDGKKIGVYVLENPDAEALMVAKTLGISFSKERNELFTYDLTEAQELARELNAESSADRELYSPYQVVDWQMMMKNGGRPVYPTKARLQVPDENGVMRDQSVYVMNDIGADEASLFDIAWLETGEDGEGIAYLPPGASEKDARRLACKVIANSEGGVTMTDRTSPNKNAMLGVEVMGRFDNQGMPVWQVVGRYDQYIKQLKAMGFLCEKEPLAFITKDPHCVALLNEFAKDVNAEPIKYRSAGLPIILFDTGTRQPDGTPIYMARGETYENKAFLEFTRWTWDADGRAWMNGVPTQVDQLMHFMSHPRDAHDFIKSLGEGLEGMDQRVYYADDHFSADEYQRSRSTQGESTEHQSETHPLSPYQEVAVNHAMMYGNSMIADDMGVGKALPINTPILTPFGWKLMGDIQVGDIVTGSNGKGTQVVGVYPQGLKPAYKVTFNDGASTVCCDEHLWAVNTPVRKQRGNPYRVMELKNIMSDLRDAAGNCKHYIPMVEAVQFLDKQELPLHPYLIGALLGDGGVTEKSSVKFTNVDTDIVERLKAILPDGMTTTSDGISYRLVDKSRPDNRVLTALRYLGLQGHGSDTKFIPEDYLWSDESARRELLRGLLDTDGYVDKRGIVQFSSNSVKLRDDVVFIVQSLGGVARKSQKISASGKDHFICTIALPGDWNPFYCERKANRWKERSKYQPTRAIVSAEYVGEVPMQCIAVDAPDHLFVVEDFIVTHNTAVAINLISHDIASMAAQAPEGTNPLAYVNQNYRCLIVTTASAMSMVWPGELQKFLGRIARNQEGKVAVTYSLCQEVNSPIGNTAIVITNHDKLNSRPQDLQSMPWNRIIIDEAHVLKKSKAKSGKNQLAGRLTGLIGHWQGDASYKKSKGLADIPNCAKTVLTGTPVPNRIQELWSLLHFLHPEMFPSYIQFEQTFITMEPQQVRIKTKDKRTGEKTAKFITIWVATGVKNIDLLNRILRGGGTYINNQNKEVQIPPIMVRRLKSQVFREGRPGPDEPQTSDWLPTKDHIVKPIKMDAEDLLTYNAVMGNEAAKEFQEKLAQMDIQMKQVAGAMKQARSKTANFNPEEFRALADEAMNLSMSVEKLFSSGEALEQMSKVRRALGSIMAKHSGNELAALLDENVRALISRSPKTDAMGKPIYETYADLTSHNGKTKQNKVYNDESRKVVVFAYHKDVVNDLLNRANRQLSLLSKKYRRQLVQAGVLLDGLEGQELKAVALSSHINATSAKKNAIQQDFQHEANVRCIICSYALKEGVTLTAGSVLLRAEPSWVPSDMLQSRDRIYRRGQEKDVKIVDLSTNRKSEQVMGEDGKMQTKLVKADPRAEDTLIDYMYSLVAQKEELQKAVLDEDLMEAPGKDKMPNNMPDLDALNSELSNNTQMELPEEEFEEDGINDDDINAFASLWESAYRMANREVSTWLKSA